MFLQKRRRISNIVSKILSICRLLPPSRAESLKLKRGLQNMRPACEGRTHCAFQSNVGHPMTKLESSFFFSTAGAKQLSDSIFSFTQMVAGRKVVRVRPEVECHACALVAHVFLKQFAQFLFLPRREMGSFHVAFQQG